LRRTSARRPGGGQEISCAQEDSRQRLKCLTISIVTPRPVRTDYRNQHSAGEVTSPILRAVARPVRTCYFNASRLQQRAVHRWSERLHDGLNLRPNPSPGVLTRLYVRLHRSATAQVLRQCKRIPIQYVMHKVRQYGSMRATNSSVDLFYPPNWQPLKSCDTVACKHVR